VCFFILIELVLAIAAYAKRDDVTALLLALFVSY